ncbi:MAG TPA: TIGR02300 family protein [Pseudolabrys sp.]|nr:TIGR02300 family protein [Pseudolabrys sp.]
MAKPDLGTKRVCSGCGAKFYDLNRTPIVCPKCETVFVPVVAAPRTRPDTKVAPAPAPVAEAVVPETADAEFVSLDDAEAEQQGKKPAGKGEEGEAEGDDGMDAAFIEEQEESGDVTDIIGETPIEKEEEQ